MAHPITKKKRCISAIKARLPKHGLMKSLRLVSDLEQVPSKTLEDWYYRAQKEKEAKAEAQEKKQVESAKVLDGRVANRQASRPDPPPPLKPILRADSGRYLCSQCGTGKHIRELEDGNFFCGICKVNPPYDPGEDYQVKSYDPNATPYYWML